MAMITTPQFQSSPAPKGGRYLQTCPSRTRLRCFNPRPPRRAGATNLDGSDLKAGKEFQSSPAPKGGRYKQLNLLRAGTKIVSILARPEGRALPIPIMPSTCILRVSILARPEGRALPAVAIAKAATIAVSILARPEGRALLEQQLTDAIAAQFQSSPAPKGGRYQFSGTAIKQPTSFNPRPPRRAGAT